MSSSSKDSDTNVRTHEIIKSVPSKSSNSASSKSQKSALKSVTKLDSAKSAKFDSNPLAEEPLGKLLKSPKPSEPNAKIGSGKIGSGKIGSGKIGSAKTDSAKSGSAKSTSAKAGSAKGGSDKTRSRSASKTSSRVGSNFSAKIGSKSPSRTSKSASRAASKPSSRYGSKPTVSNASPKGSQHTTKLPSASSLCSSRSSMRSERSKTRSELIELSQMETNSLVPGPVDWTAEECVAWLYIMGLPRYEETFRVNGITGKKLILLCATHLCKMGIQDWEHIKTLTGGIRALVNQPASDYFRTISLPHKEPLGLFMELKSRTGVISETMTYAQWLEENAHLLEHCFGQKVDPFNEPKALTTWPPTCHLKNIQDGSLKVKDDMVVAEVTSQEEEEAEKEVAGEQPHAPNIVLGDNADRQSVEEYTMKIEYPQDENRQDAIDEETGAQQGDGNPQCSEGNEEEQGSEKLASEDQKNQNSDLQDNYENTSQSKDEDSVDVDVNAVPQFTVEENSPQGPQGNSPQGNSPQQNGDGDSDEQKEGENKQEENVENNVPQLNVQAKDSLTEVDLTPVPFADDNAPQSNWEEFTPNPEGSRPQTNSGSRPQTNSGSRPQTNADEGASPAKDGE